MLLALCVPAVMISWYSSSTSAAISGVDPADDYVMDEPMPKGAEGLRVIELDFTIETILPNDITLKAGEKVLFVITNSDPKEDHNLIEADAGLREILVHPGQTARRIWTAPAKTGSYIPACAIHPWIRMTMVVE